MTAGRDRGSADTRRFLREAPGPTVVLMATLATAIALVVPILGLVRATFARPARYTHPLLRDDGAADWLPGWTAAARTSADIQADALGTLFSILLGLVLLLLVLALVNALTLLLTRAVARRSEVALRAALGAVRWRLVRQLVRESAIPILGATAAGLGGAFALSRVLHASWPGGAAPWGAPIADPQVLLATLAVLVLLPLLAWLTPIRVAGRTDLRRFLTTGSRSTTGVGEMRSRQTLATAQISAALVLLTSAGLLLRGFSSGPDLEGLGFDPSDTLTVHVQLPASLGGAADRRPAFHAEAVRRLGAAPGIVAAAVATPGTWLGIGATDDVTAVCAECWLAGLPKPVSEGPVRIHAVSPGFFAALGSRVTRGREHVWSDDAHSPPAVVVNSTMAYRLFPGGDPLGKRVQIGGREGDWLTVIGVVDDLRAPAIGSGAELVPALYLSTLQHPAASLDLAVRTSGDPLAALPELERIFSVTAPGAKITRPMAMLEYLDRVRAPLRWFSILLGWIAAISLLFAASGLHQAMSGNVTRRRREIGIRMAVGARERDVTRMVVREGLLVTWVGTIVGLIGALSVARLLQLVVRGVDPFDPLLFAAIAVLLATVALASTRGPARRAAAVDPQVALRSD